MLSIIMRHAAYGAAFAIVSAAPALAAATDYKFEVVTAQPAGPQKTDVTVRLVHAADSKPVADAVIFETHADMGPEGMPTMPGDVTAGAPQSGGAYRFQVATAMAGTWALTLSAKVQGESQTVKGTVNFKVVK
jgi:hypothetical protein